MLLPPANEVCEDYVFSPVCQLFCSQGGGSMHGCRGCVWLWVACVIVRGVWLWGGVHGCGGMHGCGGGHVWLWGVCVWLWGCAWLQGIPRRDTVNERAVRILLECILVVDL